ncbi:hypothetical protein IV417_03155 [Alphaproteobacteria bacterium KMM 3653]|uniref:Uncharacterized protein n=1 Tax=Harenicola maris TaxID=2841044 RepID=A0AAP2CNJ1_9RHOB|nr:hypothetical protein [Harenicola maris]
MIYPEHNRPGDSIANLALDAAKPLYQKLGLVGLIGGADATNQFLKEVVEYSQFARFHGPLWKAMQDYAHAALPKDQAEAILAWFFTAYTGYHPANPNMSIWTYFLGIRAVRTELWPRDQFEPEEMKAEEAFTALFAAHEDAEGFMDMITDIQENTPLSQWDKKLHQINEFVYFDRAAGDDPFLKLKFVNSATALRRAIAEFDFPSKPGFPHEKLRAVAQLEADRGWMPEGVSLGTLLEVV